MRGTIADVSIALGYSSSTVSQQLSVLEREAGVALLEPVGRRVQLTPQGQLLAAHAARALEMDESARTELASATSLRTLVRVAAMPTAAESLVPKALTLLAERSPHLRLDVSEMAPEQGLFELTARSFDLVVAEQYPGHTRELREGIIRTVIGRDAVRVALPVREHAADLYELRHHSWIFEPQGTAVRQWAVQQCRAAGFEPEVRFEATDLHTHIRMVAEGHAVAMLPDLVWSPGHLPVRLLDLPGAPAREIFTASRESSSNDTAIALVRVALTDALSARSAR